MYSTTFLLAYQDDKHVKSVAFLISASMQGFKHINHCLRVQYIYNWLGQIVSLLGKVHVRT